MLLVQVDIHMPNKQTDRQKTFTYTSHCILKLMDHRLKNEMEDCDTFRRNVEHLYALAIHKMI